MRQIFTVILQDIFTRDDYWRQIYLWIQRHHFVTESSDMRNIPKCNDWEISENFGI